MAICRFCGNDMSKADGCVKIPVKIGGKDMDPIKYGDEKEEADTPERCHDCNAQKGHFHHPGCDMERCPKCGGQLISCGCMDDEDEYL